MKQIKRLYPFVCLSLIVGTVSSSCASGKNSAAANISTAITVADTVSSSDLDHDVATESYTYEKPDMNGYTLRLLNTADLWNMYIYLDFDETDGEVLNDAVYNRNRKVEQELNCTLDVISVDAPNGDMINLCNQLSESVLAGDDLYDVAFIPVYTKPDMLTSGYFEDLNTIEGLNLSEPWWGQYVNQAATFENCLYFTTTAMHLMSFDGEWCLFFNEDMLKSQDMDLPYDLVRNGKWTVDAMLDYCKATTNLNGDSSFKWDKNGKSIYGISAHENCPEKFILGCGEYLVKQDKDGIPVFSADNDRFYNVISKLAPLLDISSGYDLRASTEDFNADLGGYCYVFSSGRSLFLTAEIKTAQRLRDMNTTFGILPYPKYDENQDNYYSSFVNQCLFYTIPVTNTHLKETAVISDVLSYESYANVLPVYYDITVSQKGLRNENSVEMLNIIRDTSTVDLSMVFGWTQDLVGDLRTALYAGSDSVTSIITKREKKITASIQKTMDAIRENQN